MPSLTNDSADLAASLTQEEAELYQIYSKNLALPSPSSTGPRSPCSPLITISEELDLFTVHERADTCLDTSSSVLPPESTVEPEPDPFTLYQRAIIAFCPSALSSAEEGDPYMIVQYSPPPSSAPAPAATHQPSPGTTQSQSYTLRRTARPTLTLRTSFLAGEDENEDEVFETWQLAASLISPSLFTFPSPSRSRLPASSSPSSLPSCFTSPSTLFPTSPLHSVALASSPTQSPQSTDKIGPATSDQNLGCRVLALQGKLYEAMRLHALRSMDTFQAGQKVEVDSEQVRGLEQELEEEMGRWRDERLSRYFD